MAAESQEAEAAVELRTRVRTCIVESGMTQNQFSRRIDLDQTKLSKSLRGTRRFNPQELIRIATAAGVTVSWLLSGTDTAEGSTAVQCPASSPESLPTRAEDDHGVARKRYEIVEAAWRLFAERGFHAVRIADIAAACDTSSSNVHYYFSSKRELFEDSLRYCAKLAYDRQVAALDPTRGHRERLNQIIALQLPAAGPATTEWSIWLQSWSAVAVGAASRDNQSAAYRRWWRTVHDVLREGQNGGEFLPGPTAELTTLLTSLIDGFGIKVLLGALTAEDMRFLLDRFIDRVIVARFAAAGSSGSDQPVSSTQRVSSTRPEERVHHES